MKVPVARTTDDQAEGLGQNAETGNLDSLADTRINSVAVVIRLNRDRAEVSAVNACLEERSHQCHGGMMITTEGIAKRPGNTAMAVDLSAIGIRDDSIGRKTIGVITKNAVAIMIAGKVNTVRKVVAG